MPVFVNPALEEPPRLIEKTVVAMVIGLRLLLHEEVGILHGTLHTTTGPNPLGHLLDDGLVLISSHNRNVDRHDGPRSIGIHLRIAETHTEDIPLARLPAHEVHFGITVAHDALIIEIANDLHALQQLHGRLLLVREVTNLLLLRFHPTLRLDQLPRSIPRLRAVEVGQAPGDVIGMSCLPLDHPLTLLPLHLVHFRLATHGRLAAPRLHLLLALAHFFYLLGI